MTFYHALPFIVQVIKEVQDKYPRLVDHELPTITRDIRRLRDAATAKSDSHCAAIIIVRVKAQRFAAHAEDISTNSMLQLQKVQTVFDWFINYNTKAVWWCNGVQAK